MRKLIVLAILLVALGAMAAMAASHSPPVATTPTSLNNSATITASTAMSVTALAPAVTATAAQPTDNLQVDLESPYAYAIMNFTKPIPSVEYWTRWATLPPSTSTSWLKARFEHPSPRASPAVTNREKAIGIDDRSEISATARNAPIPMRV